MQFGESKSTLSTFAWDSFIAGSVTFIIWFWKSISLAKIAILFSGIEGTVLLASAFTASGHVPAQGNLFRRFVWFFKGQGAVPVYFIRPVFYGGLLFLTLSFIISAMTD